MYDERKIITCLVELELIDYKHITEEDVRSQYKKLTKVYHPDVAPAAFKDGIKFRRIKDSYNFLLENLDTINAYLSGDDSSSSAADSRSYSTEEKTPPQNDYQSSYTYNDSYSSYSSRSYEWENEFSRQNTETEEDYSSKENHTSDNTAKTQQHTETSSRTEREPVKTKNKALMIFIAILSIIVFLNNEDEAVIAIIYGAVTILAVYIFDRIGF